MNKTKIGIIDYGAGNLGSIYNAIKYLEVKTDVVSSAEKINSFSHLILPGVGSFGKLAENLQAKDWPFKIENFVKKGNFLLGVCVGMQLLFEHSQESTNATGLKLLKGSFSKFDKNNSLPLPHVGFNEVKSEKTKIWNGIKNNSPFYFIHSYKLSKTDEKIIKGFTNYGEKFISFIEKENIYGCQFHPEKSHYVGLKLLKNFAGLNN